MNKRTLTIVIAIVAIAGAAYYFLNSATGDKTASNNASNIKVPKLSLSQTDGEKLFEGYCSDCHGKAGSGTDQGPPLIHKIYEPNHHGDFSFVSAAKNGVRAHHWQFGNMVPVEGIKDDEIKLIISYVRAVQRENGIQ